MIERQIEKIYLSLFSGIRHLLSPPASGYTLQEISVCTSVQQASVPCLLFRIYIPAPPRYRRPRRRKCLYPHAPLWRWRPSSKVDHVYYRNVHTHQRAFTDTFIDTNEHSQMCLHTRAFTNTFTYTQIAFSRYWRTSLSMSTFLKFKVLP